MAVDGSELAKFAQEHIGLKYTYGGTSLKDGADPSGFVQAVYAQYGIPIPRLSYDQINEGNKITMGDLQQGDLVFFDTDRNRGGADHVGIYVGGGKFIHNPKAGKTVQVSNLLDGYYNERYMAGRRPTGMLGGGKDSENEQVFSRTMQDPMELAAEYGWSYSYLNGNPELKNLFGQAVQDDWTAEKFKAEVQGTEWWKTTSSFAREAELLAQTDPATFAAKVEAATIQVRMKAQEIGAIVPESMMAKIAEDVIRTGMPEEQLSTVLAGYIKFTEEGTLAGTAGQAQFRLKQLAYMNGVEMSDQSILNYAQQIAMGVSTMEQAEQNVRNMAISMFPAYEDQINGGVNMINVASPYIQTLAKNLEINPNAISLSDPRIKNALNGLSSGGVPSGTTFTDFENQIRRSQEWLSTKNAQNSLMSTGSQVLKTMGLM